MIVPCVCMFVSYIDNLFIVSFYNLVVYLDYLSAMFTLFEFFGILLIVFVFILFRTFLLNSTLTPTLPTGGLRGDLINNALLTPTTRINNHHFLVLGTLKYFF